MEAFKTTDTTISMSGKERRGKILIPFWEKYTLTIEEAAAYSGIGINRLRTLTEDETCTFVLWIGSRRVIKRIPFEKFIDNTYSM